MKGVLGIDDKKQKKEEEKKIHESNQEQYLRSGQGTGGQPYLKRFDDYE